MKQYVWLFFLAGIMLLSFSCKHQAKQQTPAQPTEKKIIKKDDSALKYNMFKAEKGTVERVAQYFKSFLEEEGMYYPRFLDFQHAAQIDNIEFKMNPTVLVIFGNPKEMGVLINENPEAAYDLPFRILIFQNENGEVWVMYKDFNALKEQYFLSDDKKILEKYDKLLQKFQSKLPTYLNRENQNKKA